METPRDLYVAIPVYFYCTRCKQLMGAVDMGTPVPEPDECQTCKDHQELVMAIWGLIDTLKETRG